VVNVGGGKDDLSCGLGNSTPCASIDYAIFGSLNVSANSPKINLVGNSSINSNVDITGLSVGSETVMWIVHVPKGIFLLVNCSSDVCRNTIVQFVTLRLESSTVIRPFLQAVSVSKSAGLSLLNVIIQFSSLLKASLVSISGLSMFNASDFAVVKVLCLFKYCNVIIFL
jgi:hypothetical protein